MESIPKTIWILWIQGWEAAPKVVLMCARSWKRQNPTWLVRSLSKENLGEFVDLPRTHPGIKGKALPQTALADIVRIALLKKHGGVWVDATLYCNRPLDHWIYEVLPSGFFAFDRPAHDRMVASFFLAAKPGHYIVKTWDQLNKEYWLLRESRNDYFWSHYLFRQAYEKDPCFKHLWDVTPKISAEGANYFVPYHKLPNSLSPEDKMVIDSAAYPVFKLTHKWKWWLGKEVDELGIRNDSVLAYLQSRAS